MSEPTLYQDHQEARPEDATLCPAYRYDARHRFDDDGVCIGCFGMMRLVVPVEPDAWGITSWRQLYDNMTVAENDGDWLECTEALGAALGIGDTE